MKSILAKQSDGTIQLTITIPTLLVKEAWKKVVDAITAQTQVPGFRKGKAPKKLVEDKIDQELVREEVLKELLPKAYSDAVAEHNLHPIIHPKIHVEKIENDKDWEFTATSCETPEVNLGDYKDKVKDITSKSKIVVPGKEPQKPSFDEIVGALLTSVQIVIPKVLLDQEVDRLLSQMLDEIKRLGLNLDQYLSSTGKTVETLRSDYEKKAENDIKLEFTLRKIADVEKIAVEEKEIDEAIQKAKTDEERENLAKNRYLLASIIRQQKTLDFLTNL